MAAELVQAVAVAASLTFVEQPSEVEVVVEAFVSFEFSISNCFAYIHCRMKDSMVLAEDICSCNRTLMVQRCSANVDSNDDASRVAEQSNSTSS